MNTFKIALRSLQYRGLGSALTLLSMALGVMMVVAVLTIHGVVSQSFRANSSFGYNVLLGSRGGSMQLTLNTVYYLSKPLEPIPFEYYLAFRDQATRRPYLMNSIAVRAHRAQQQTLELAAQLAGGWSGGGIAQTAAQTAAATALDELAIDQMTLRQNGRFAHFAAMAIPLTLGDSWSKELRSGAATFRVVGTTSEFFTQLRLDADTQRTFTFDEGRPFHDYDPQHGFFECVIGSRVARSAGLKLGDPVNPIHGDPNSQGAHIHEQAFTIVGILEPTGTPHDRAIFVNIEGFYLMDDHAKPIEEGREKDEPPPPAETEVDEFDARSSPAPAPAPDLDLDSAPLDLRKARPVAWRRRQDSDPTATSVFPYPEELTADRLPLEQREITALLIRTNPVRDEVGLLATLLPSWINNGGYLEPVLDWSSFRPLRAQVAPQAVNPVMEVANLFYNIVDPVQWILLGLTILICIVSGISILVGIYNSMNQRRHEIAVMRALGARRARVMRIMLAESMLLSLGGGLMGWMAGHALNAAVSPLVEAKAGVRIGFFDFAPRIPVFEYLLPGISNWGSSFVKYASVSSEFLLIPGLIVLAIAVGVYPAISAYRTDVARSLGS